MTPLRQAWPVVAACFAMAAFSWGFGFYGCGVYLVQLQAEHGWSAALVSAAVTTFFLTGALMVMTVVGGLYERFGARRVATAGVLGFAGAMLAVAHAAAPWQMFAAFVLLALAWSLTSSVAINIILAAWFDKGRGMALSLALTGASLGGVAVAPLLVLAIGRFGFERSMIVGALLMALLLVPLAQTVLRRMPPVREAVGTQAKAPAFSLRDTLATPAFWTIATPFAIGMTAQVAFLTHQLAILEPLLTRNGAAAAVSLTGAAAVIGRLGSGVLADRLSRRVLAFWSLALQAGALLLLASAQGSAALYAACALFGLGVGNQISLPPLLVQQEFPVAHFARVTGLVVGACQFTFASGPLLLGALRAASESYAPGIYACAATIAAAALTVRWGPAVLRSA